MAKVSDIADLVNATLDDLGPPRFEQIAQRLTDYEIMGRLLKKDRILIKSGKGVERRVMLDHSGAARHTEMYGTDQTNITDVLKLLNVPWRFAETHYLIERRENLMNTPPSELVDLLELRRADAMISLTEELETKGWSKPTDSADGISPWGIAYWIVKNTSEGFNGGNPSGFSDTGGISAALEARWNNWTAQYSAVSASDLIRRMRRAHLRTGFKSPVDIPDLRSGKGERFRIYMNGETKLTFEEVAVAQNNQLGSDVASMDDRTVFKKNPIIYVAELDADATDPVYMIDTSTLFIVALKGDVLNESGMKPLANSHNTLASFVDLTYNFACIDRRRNAVISK